MNRIRLIALPFFAFSLAAFAQDEQTAPQLPVTDPICPYFTRQAEQFSPFGSPSQENGGRTNTGHTMGSTSERMGRLTQMVAAALPPPPGGGRTSGSINVSKLNGLIDPYIFSELESAGVQPAEPTTDWEFVRRIYLDLTGRIPTAAQTLSFVNSTSPTKRADLVESLLASTQWLDKWTMFYGDLYKNVSQNAQITVYKPSVQSFYQYIRGSLAANKPYDQMAREMITATGSNSYSVGAINLVVNGVVTGGPVQDIYDQQTANIADVFLGCLLYTSPSPRD